MVVAGCGPIGLGMVLGAVARSPAHVVALDVFDSKLELARLCGADVIVNVARDDPMAVVAELTEGYGADVYLEGSGHAAAVPQGLRLLRKLGTYVEYGVFGSDVTVDWSIISDDKELDVRGAHLGAELLADSNTDAESQGRSQWTRSAAISCHLRISRRVSTSSPKVAAR